MKAKGNKSVEKPHLRQHDNRQSKYMDICSLNKTENEEHQRLYHAPPLKTETAFPYSS